MGYYKSHKMCVKALLTLSAVECSWFKFLWLLVISVISVTVTFSRFLKNEVT